MLLYCLSPKLAAECKATYIWRAPCPSSSQSFGFCECLIHKTLLRNPAPKLTSGKALQTEIETKNMEPCIFYTGIQGLDAQVSSSLASYSQP